MKKRVIILMALLCICVMGCGNTNTVSNEEYEKVVAERDELKERVALLENELENYDSSDASVSEFAEEENVQATAESSKVKQSDETQSAESEIEILAEYTLTDSIGWYTRHFMVIKNNSVDTVDVSTSSLAYDENNTMVGAASADFTALGAGCISVFYEAFETDTKIDHYETEFNISKSKHYESVIQDLTYTQNDVSNGAVFQVTNNGKDAAEFVEGYALFFSGDELVGYENTYFVDDDSEIKPGKTISKQMTAYKDFDRIEFYLTGRK
jgi:hypothetical protein